jgi:rhodanese-related sulfurtransferase
VETETGYAGDIEVSEVWTALAEDADAALVDVRSVAEWTFVGIPDLAGIGKSVILIEWQSFPSMVANGKFIDELEEALTTRGIARNVPIYFMCRSGARSKAAAVAATASGLVNCYNVLDGFEGALDEDKHRGSTSGWKVAGLPWIQS